MKILTTMYGKRLQIYIEEFWGSVHFSGHKKILFVRRYDCYLVFISFQNGRYLLSLRINIRLKLKKECYIYKNLLLARV